MIFLKKVRGTQKAVPNIEVNIDTVYIRENVSAVNDDGFSGWEYDETQYGKNEYIESIAEQNNQLQSVNDQLILDNLNMQNQIDNLISAQLTV